MFDTKSFHLIFIAFCCSTLYFLQLFAIYALVQECHQNKIIQCRVYSMSDTFLYRNWVKYVKTLPYCIRILLWNSKRYKRNSLFQEKYAKELKFNRRCSSRWSNYAPNYFAVQLLNYQFAVYMLQKFLKNIFLSMILPKPILRLPYYW